ncbi:MAG: hypothetical protein OEY38_19165 [Gammaproteobacteria bacterium]|nr:hypothetical protein [Gammaproteobacteria bacterium]
MSINELNIADAAYIAGLIDGEGTITLIREHKNENRRLVLSISNTERYLLEYVLEKVGYGSISTKKTYQDNHTPSFTYKLTSRKALDLVKQIYPYLRTHKLKRAEMLLNDYVRLTPRNGKYSSELIEQRRKFENDFFRFSNTSS